MTDNSLVIMAEYKPEKGCEEICQIRAKQDRRYGKQDDVDQANAELIVRAVNSHHELLEACKSTAKELELLREMWPHGSHRQAVLDKANAAIAKAEPIKINPRWAENGQPMTLPNA
jgi:hypothetical protein